MLDLYRIASHNSDRIIQEYHVTVPSYSATTLYFACL